MPTDVRNIQQTIDAFESTDMQRKHQRQSNLVPLGAATKAISGTLRKIKEQKDAARAQSVVDRAKKVKERLDLMLQGKTAEEQEEVMGSSTYQDAYQALVDEATAIGGAQSEAAQGVVGSIQQSTKLAHISGLMKTMGAERKEKVKDTLERFRATVAVNPDRAEAAAADARTSLMMVLQTESQRKEFTESLKQNAVLGQLEAYTNTGPSNDPHRAMELLDSPGISKFLTAKQMRTYRNYVKSQLKGVKDKSASTRNDIMGYAANTGDLHSMMRSLEDPNLNTKHKRQLKSMVQVAQAQTLGAKPITEDIVNKLLIKNPKNKEDRDFNEKTRSVYKKLGDMYTANPIDAVLAVMGPEYEAILGVSDAVADTFGSRLSSNRAAQISSGALEALENGTAEEFHKSLTNQYKGLTNKVMLEAMNRQYYGRTDAQSRAEHAALTVTYNNTLKGIFKPGAVAKVLANPVKPIETSYVPLSVQRLKHTLTPEEYEAVEHMTKLNAAVLAAENVAEGEEQKTQEYNKQVNYNAAMTTTAGFMSKKVADLQRTKSWWPAGATGLLKGGKPVILNPELISTLTLEEAMDNRDKVREQLTPTQLRRYKVNFDDFSNELLANEATDVYLKRDPRGDGTRFNVVLSSPTGITFDPGMFDAEQTERQENLLTQADGQVFQVSATEIYKHGVLLPDDWDREPEDFTWFNALSAIGKDVVGRARQKIAAEVFGVKQVMDGAIDPEQVQFARQASDNQVMQEEQLRNLETLPTQKQNPTATLYNLKTHHERKWQQDVRPALLANNSKWKGAAAKIPQETKLNLMKAIAYIESNFDPKATSEKKAEGIFQLHGDNKKGIDTRNTMQAAGRAIEVMSDAYNLAKRVANITKGATEQDTIILAARIYNGGRSFAVDEDGNLQTDTMERIMRGASSLTKGGKHENVTYANKLYKIFGFTKRLKATPGTDEAIPILEPKL